MLCPRLLKLFPDLLGDVLSRWSSEGHLQRAGVTTRKADELLMGLGYLKGEPTLKLAAKDPELKIETVTVKP